MPELKFCSVQNIVLGLIIGYSRLRVGLGKPTLILHLPTAIAVSCLTVAYFNDICSSLAVPMRPNICLA
jgi:hypothetical protein